MVETSVSQTPPLAPWRRKPDHSSPKSAIVADGEASSPLSNLF